MDTTGILNMTDEDIKAQEKFNTVLSPTADN
jgi:hypothetical protein